MLVPLTAHLLWATGSTSGLTATKIAERTSDFYASRRPTFCSP